MAKRMRYPDQAYDLLVQEDPGTSVTRNLVRSIAKSGKIPFYQNGRRRLIDYDALREYLENPPAADEVVQFGMIRKIAR